MSDGGHFRGSCKSVTVLRNPRTNNYSGTEFLFTDNTNHSVVFGFSIKIQLSLLFSQIDQGSVFEIIIKEIF